MSKETDKTKIEALLFAASPGGSVGRRFDTIERTAQFLVDNEIGDVASLARQLEESEQYRATQKAVLDDYIDREYNPENPDHVELI